MRIYNPTFGVSATSAEKMALKPVNWKTDAIALISNSKPNARELLHVSGWESAPSREFFTHVHPQDQPRLQAAHGLLAVFRRAHLVTVLVQQFRKHVQFGLGIINQQNLLHGHIDLLAKSGRCNCRACGEKVTNAEPQALYCATAFSN